MSEKNIDNKQIISKDDLTPYLIEGMKKIAGAVKRTLGPGGLTILIERVGQQLNGDPLGPKMTKDGVSVAEECSDVDPRVDLAIQTVKAICKKTNAGAGDGTTSAVVLGEAIFLESMSILEQNKSINPQLLREALEKSSKKVVQRLKEIAAPVKDPKTIAEVATISANGDVEIGSLIGQAFEAVGSEGVVTIEEGTSVKNKLSVIEGYHFNRGAENRDVFFNNKDRTAWEANNVHVLVFDDDLRSPETLMKPLQIIYEGNENKMPSVLILANDFSTAVIQWLVIQKMERGFDFCAVRGPHVTHVRSGYYDDLCTMLGGFRFGGGNRDLTTFTYDDVGICAKAKVTKYATTLYEGQGTEEDILERVRHLKALKEQAESPYDAQILEDRLGNLTQGIAKIAVGGSTELEIKEKYDRIEDALNAARAAIEEGVLIGGGSTLYRIALELESNPNDGSIDALGDLLLAKCLKAPLNQILDNLGLSEDLKKVVFEKLVEDGMVYDAREKVFKKGLESGIIDPAKVTRLGLENAISISGLLSTTGGGIIYNRK